MLSVLIVFLSFSAKNVFLNIEKFNRKLNLLHIGITFSDKHKSVRYDFKPFSTGGSYETDIESRFNSEAYPNLPLVFNEDLRPSEFETKTIKWGETNKTWKEISEFETKTLCTKRYIIGIYDCRHYTRDFTGWCCDNQTPVWNLDNLWNSTHGS